MWKSLLERRVIYLPSAITPLVANTVVGCLLALEGDEPADLFINSPGGSIASAFAIIDVMGYVRPHVRTRVVGIAHSAAALILAAGQTRSAARTASVLIHPPRQGTVVQGVSPQTAEAELQHWTEEYRELLLRRTWLSVGDLFTQRVMTATEAKLAGIVDVAF